MIKKSTLLHLRFPFSFFLLPVFMLAGGVVEEMYAPDVVLVFFVLHLLVYPASNGYNSYFDKDEGSIGGLKNPPKVTTDLYYVALLLDLIALLLSLLISLEFTMMVLIYGLVSKAYSHPAIRLKKYPIIGWLTAGIFQGYFTYLLCYIALSNTPLRDTFTEEIQLPGILSSWLLLGSYPMTQVYQHDEDAGRGDMTISRLLGIKNTFHFTAIMFVFSSSGFVYYFSKYLNPEIGMLFLVALSPVLFFFGVWYLKVRRHTATADYDRTMKLNLLSSLLLNGFFAFLWII